MIKAIYIAREDGDYDFLAAFDGESRWDIHPADTYAEEWQLDTGDELIVKDFSDLSHLTDVIEGWEANFEKKLGAIK